MQRALLLALWFAGSVARADDAVPSAPIDPLEARAARAEPDAYAAAGVVVGDSQGFEVHGAILDLGKRIASGLPWFGRAALQAGAIGRSDNPGDGEFLELRAGAEGRDCSGRGMLCGSIGVDLGVRRGEFRHRLYADNGSRTDIPERLDAVVAVPRFTVDAGGRIRFRAVLEVPLAMRRADDSATTAAALGGPVPPGPADNQFAVGVALSLALAIGF